MVVVSSMFIVTYGSILMVTALKSRPGDSGICVALVLVSGYCLFFFSSHLRSPWFLMW